MGFTWEAARWALAAAAGSVWLFFTAVNLLMTAVRFAQRKRASSVPLVGLVCGVVALVAIPVSLSWEWAVAVLAGLVVLELLGCLWPASLVDPPHGAEKRNEAS